MFELRPKRVDGLVSVRRACHSFSARIQTNVSSRKFRVRGSVVGGMRCMSFACESSASLHRILIVCRGFVARIMADSRK
jgi:hypothetical protein